MGGGRQALELLLQPVGLAAPVACLAGFARAVRRHLPWPSQVAMPPTMSPRANAPSRNRNSGASSEKAGLGAAEGIENEERGLAIDDGKRDQHDAEGNDDEAENQLTPHGRLRLPFGTR